MRSRRYLVATPSWLLRMKNMEIVSSTWYLIYGQKVLFMGRDSIHGPRVRFVDREYNLWAEELSYGSKIRFMGRGLDLLKNDLQLSTRGLHL